MQQLQQQRQARLAALAQLAGVQDERGLAQLQVLEARVGGDACMVTLDTICRELPQLRVLRLDSSRLPCPQPFAGLFGGLCTSLAVLAVNACCLSSLEGLGLLQQLRELYAAGNQLADLAPLAGLGTLQLLNLQDNAVADADMLLYLTDCSRLASIKLAGNPISHAAGYTSQVRQQLPAVQYLDGRHIRSCSDSSGGGNCRPALAAEAPATGGPCLSVGVDGAEHPRHSVCGTLAHASRSCSGSSDPLLAGGSCAALPAVSRPASSQAGLPLCSCSWTAGSNSSSRPTTAGNRSSSGSSSRPATGGDSSGGSPAASRVDSGCKQHATPGPMARGMSPSPAVLAAGSEAASMASWWLQRQQLELESSSRSGGCHAGGAQHGEAASNLTCRGGRPLSGSAVLGLRQRQRAVAEADATRPACPWQRHAATPIGSRRVATAPERLGHA